MLPVSAHSSNPNDVVSPPLAETYYLYLMASQIIQQLHLPVQPSSTYLLFKYRIAHLVRQISCTGDVTVAHRFLSVLRLKERCRQIEGICMVGGLELGSYQNASFQQEMYNGIIQLADTLRSPLHADLQAGFLNVVDVAIQYFSGEAPLLQSPMMPPKALKERGALQYYSCEVNELLYSGQLNYGLTQIAMRALQAHTCSLEAEAHLAYLESIPNLDAQQKMTARHQKQEIDERLTHVAQELFNACKSDLTTQTRCFLITEALKQYLVASDDVVEAIKLANQLGPLTMSICTQVIPEYIFHSLHQ